MMKYALARSLAFSFAIVVSVSAYSDTGDRTTITGQPESNIEVKLDFSQRNKICDGILSSFNTLKFRVENETGKPFSEGYKLVHCPIPGEKKIGWDLIGAAFKQPPSSRAIRVAKDLFEYLEKTDPALLQYIFTHKDYNGRDIYAYLKLAHLIFSGDYNPMEYAHLQPNDPMLKQYPQPADDRYKKYYRIFTEQVTRFDPNKQP